MIEFQYSTRFGRYQKLILSCYFMNIPCRYHRSNGFFHSCRWKQWGLLKLSMCQVVKFMICGLPIPRIFSNTTARWFAGILIVSRFSNLIPSPFWPFILPWWIVKKRSVENMTTGYKFLGFFRSQGRYPSAAWVPGWRPFPNWGRVFSWFLLLEMFFFPFLPKGWETHIFLCGGFKLRWSFSSLILGVEDFPSWQVLPFLQKRVVVFVWWLPVACLLPFLQVTFEILGWISALLPWARKTQMTNPSRGGDDGRHRWDLDSQTV